MACILILSRTTLAFDLAKALLELGFTVVTSLSIGASDPACLRAGAGRWLWRFGGIGSYMQQASIGGLWVTDPLLGATGLR